MKNRIKKIIIVCTLLICFIFLITRVTYSSYESNTAGSVNGNIAGWNIKVNDVIVSNEVDKEVDIDDVVWNATHTRSGKLAPGSTGTFNIKLDFSGTEVAVRFDIEILDKTVDSNKILTLTAIDTADVTLTRTGVSTYTAVVDVDDKISVNPFLCPYTVPLLSTEAIEPLLDENEYSSPTFVTLIVSASVLVTLVFAFSIILIVFLVTRAYGSYITTAKLRADIDKAIYIFEEEKLSFNIDENKIIPSNDPYTYVFSVQNYNTSQTSDVDLTYNINIRSTTNLPLEIKLYRNDYSSLIDSDDYPMNYNSNTKDIFTLVINFPKAYSIDTTYADITENIEVIINSKQVI